MATWATISVAQFLTEGGFSTDERSKLQAAAGGDDGLTEILAAAVAEWRGVMEAAQYEVDENSATTIPPSCRRHIIAQVRWSLLIKFPSLKQLQTDERKAAAEVAEEKLQKIEDREAAIESPEVPPSDTTPGPNFGTRTRDYERTDQDGL